MVLSAVAGLAGVGGTVYAVVGAAPDPGSPGAGLPLIKRGTDRVLWDDNGGAPLPVETSAGPSFLGRVRHFPADNLAIRAVRASDATTVWEFHVGLGTYLEGYQSTWYAATAGVVAITGKQGAIYLLDALTGAVRHERKLSDNAKRICVADGSFLIEQVDKRNVHVDPATGAMTEVSKGACPEDDDEPGPTPSVAGFKATATFPGSPLVAVGVKDPGTPVPRAVGFDGKKALWTMWIPAIDLGSVANPWGEVVADRQGDTLCALYGEGSEIWHVTAIDTRSGARLWDVKLRPIFAVDSVDRIMITNDRLLVERTSSLDVLDLNTGALVGVVGDDTYDK